MSKCFRLKLVKIVLNKWGESMDYKYSFTVFTPTYNRAEKISRVYESLKDQSYKNFEWLIIDDGSTDNTKQIVEGYMKKANFTIRYIFKQNGGKHSAFNLGIREAQGELFIVLDSDDKCVANALEIFWDVWQKADHNLTYQIICRCMDQNGRIVEKEFPKDKFLTSYFEIKYKLGYTREAWNVFKTDIIKKFPFPEPRGYKFISESVVWNQLSRQIKHPYMLCINEPLRIYYMPDKNSGDNLTNLFLNQHIADGRLYYHLDFLNKYMECLISREIPLRVFIKSAINCTRYSLLVKKSINANKMIQPFLGRVLFHLSFPLGNSSLF